jgi:hypothetical protein
MRMYRIRGWNRALAFSCIAAAIFSACSAPTGEEYEIIPGNLVPLIGSSARVLVAPDTVRVGELFTISIRTFRSSCLVPSATLANIGSTLADLTVWDRRPTNIPCPDDFRPIPREVSLRFSEAGVATVRVSSRVPAPLIGRDSVMVVEQKVVVQ